MIKKHKVDSMRNGWIKLASINYPFCPFYISENQNAKSIKASLTIFNKLPLDK